ncbi:DUF397 domain-containing protein [Kitasatospora sp. NBC_01287]|uniref:DUF397 domain-containing protein n=1 Tax=Kitasatospora sp. NBC_01287 TaxID=2903573 RepID=UPI002255AFFE|nr:DUF397 domain-containing protein [Kitasatospora sp. NBC_01287]MCX4750299.1 DUF397 domain-containing protein [Kitasatospora sp. NBC_01287]
MSELTTARWRRSSYSGNDGGDCVEVADGQFDGLTPVRDSKDPHGPALMFRSHAFATFVASLRDGGLDSTH